MLSGVLGHQGELQGPHDLWSAWNLEPTVIVALVAALWLFARGVERRRVSTPARSAAFAGGITAAAVALLSPLDALSGELASAHMVQHVLLVLVAAPLLALSAPMPALVAGAPAGLRRAARPPQRWLHRVGRRLRPLPWVAVAWSGHTAALWFWHASGPYDAAVEHEGLHALEHTTFLATGVLLWWVVTRRRGPAALPAGHGAFLVFTMALQSVFLSVLLTFATTPWYDAYGSTERWWGLDRLGDQHLAGVIMWVPAGFVYVGAGLLLVRAWVRESGGFGDDWEGRAQVDPQLAVNRTTTPSA